MRYERFEDLPVWKTAIDFALRVFKLVEDREFKGAGDLRDQIQRSSLSISQNVAEGFERGTTNELLYFLYIARGSAGESRSALRFCGPAFGDGAFEGRARRTNRAGPERLAPTPRMGGQPSEYGHRGTATPERPVAAGLPAKAEDRAVPPDVGTHQAARKAAIG